MPIGDLQISQAKTCFDWKSRFMRGETFMLMAAGLNWSDAEVCSGKQAPTHTCKSPLESLRIQHIKGHLQRQAIFQQMEGITGFLKTLGRDPRVADLPNILGDLGSLTEYLHASLSACEDPMETVFITPDKNLLGRRLIAAQYAATAN